MKHKNGLYSIPVTMLFEKVYTVTLNVRDPDSFCTQPEINALRKLEQTYVGRCYGGSYIVQVIKITKISDCRIKTTDLTAEGYVDIEFLALVSMHATWDVVTGVVVKSRTPLIVGHSDVEASIVATVIPVEGAPSETVNVDQIVSVRVSHVMYSPFLESVTVLGPLFMCDKTAPVYRLLDNLTPRDAQHLAPLSSRIKELLTKRADLMVNRKDDVLFFETLLYSFVRTGVEGNQTVETAGAAKWEGPTGYPLSDEWEPKNILEIVDSVARNENVKTGGVWTRPLVIYRSSPLVATKPLDASIMMVSPKEAFATMLKTVEVFLKAINEMVQIYNTPDLVERHKNIWLAMRRSHLPAPN